MSVLPRDIIRHSWRYDLWQAYAIIENSDGARWRFGIPARMGFQDTEIRRVRLLSYQDAPHPSAPLFQIDIDYPGLLGPGGPGPLHFCETVFRENNQGNDALQDYLDIFHNRFIRVWLEDCVAMSPELGPAKSEATSLPLLCVLAMAGELVGGLRGRCMANATPGQPGVESAAVPDNSFFENAFLWGCPHASAAGLEKLLENAFAVRAEVEEFVGAWREFNTGLRTRLGVDKQRILGDNAVLGSQVYDVAAGIRIRLKIATPEKGREFLPGPAGTLYGPLMAIVRAYAGEETSILLELECDGKTIPVYGDTLSGKDSQNDEYDHE